MLSLVLTDLDLLMERFGHNKLLLYCVNFVSKRFHPPSPFPVYHACTACEKRLSLLVDVF